VTSPFALPDLAQQYCSVRRFTEHLAAPLSAEDQTVQTMPDVSPTSWHRAHTTWFFETFVLAGADAAYPWVDERYRYLFNSYYEAVGRRQARAERGVITRPGVAGIADYRATVDRRVLDLLSAGATGEIESLIVLGLHHEQQHQELLLMDIKHVLSCHPFGAAYLDVDRGARLPGAPSAPDAPGWVDLPGGIVEVGHRGSGFSFDNELPVHDELVRPFRLADRVVTAGEWIQFHDDGGYQRAELWLSDGWGAVQEHGWDAPMYWFRGDDGSWWHHTLTGRRPVDPAEPVCHVSFYEADAHARWAGARLPSESEWEVAAATAPGPGPTFSAGRLHPAPTPVANGGLRQMYGEVWEWTTSPYSPYPGFAPAAGAVGEYNGKFMVNQLVLKGGCCVTPDGHVRPTYRNFFRASDRWPFTGVRLAADA
jgi:ergothioneine biosynthesis protein EgtB